MWMLLKKFLAFYLFIAAVFACSIACADDSKSLVFKVQEDYSVARIPDVALCYEEPFYPDCSKNIHIAPIAGKAFYEYLDKKLYSYFLAFRGSGMAVYKQTGRYSRFVAIAGLSDKCSDSARVRFEIWSDKNQIFQSETISKNARPVQINVEIPAECRKLKLLAAVQGDMSGGRVVWGNAGFIRRDIFPTAGEVELFLPDEFKTYSLQMMDDSSNSVSYRICSANGTNPLRLQFDSSKNSGAYYVKLSQTGSSQVTDSGSWKPQASLALSNRIADKGVDRAETYPGFMELWNKDSVLIGSCFVDNIHHGYPVFNLPALSEYDGYQNKGLGLYNYTGYFNISQRDEYEFSTMSVWGSTIFIDDKFVVHWPEKHNFQGGRRCEFRNSVFLEAGIHKIEYMNYNKWPNQFTVCAWRSSSDVFRVMTGCDFVPSVKYVVSEVAGSANKPELNSFKWEVVDDTRIDMSSPALVAVRFSAVNPHGSDVEYRWDFGDGIVSTGDDVYHVFLTTGLFNVKLSTMSNGQSAGVATQFVDVNIDRDKADFYPRNNNLFENIASRVFLEHYGIRSLAGFYRYADQSEDPGWKALAADIVCAKEPGQLDIANNIDLLTDIAEYLCSIETAKYSSGVGLIEKVVNSGYDNNYQLTEIRLLYIRMLLDYVGDIAKAQGQLEHVKGMLNVAQQVKRRVLQLEIESAQSEPGSKIVLPNSKGSLSDQVARQLKVSSVMSHAMKCAETSDRSAIQEGYSQLMELLEAEPELVLDSSFNLARLALLAGADDYLQVYNIATRCQQFDIRDINAPELMYYRALALLKLQKVDESIKIYKSMAEKYPYHLKTAEIKKLLGR